MNPAEFAEAMSKVATIGDPEVAHCKADDLMCRLLIELGYAEGVMAFTALDKWYA